MARTDDAATHAAWRFYAIVARVLVGGLFIATAVLKIRDPAGFADEIQKYELAPVAITHAMAIILPWIEGLAGLLLVLSIWRCEARLLIGAMLVVFTFVKGYAYFVQGRTGSCGCGGDNVVLDWILANPQGLVTNVVLLALLAIDHHAQRLTKRRAAPPNPTDAPLI